MPCTYFPIEILQKCVKITSEPPRGVKANMIKILSDFPEEKY